MEGASNVDFEQRLGLWNKNQAATNQVASEASNTSEDRVSRQGDLPRLLARAKGRCGQAVDTGRSW